ncbi:uncharacterized protein [Equus przewalskii]|uniref:Uncharacterized protein isoform X3 n=1 Tax=Equus przewalskii TaxID=9798 RepID=A0ABM4K4E2_EQUPR
MLTQQEAQTWWDSKYTEKCPINELEIKTGVREQRPKNAKEAVAVVENVQRVPGQQGETGLEDLAAEKMRIRGNDSSPVQTEDGVLDQAGGCGEGEKRTDARDLLKVLDSGKDLSAHRGDGPFRRSQRITEIPPDPEASSRGTDFDRATELMPKTMGTLRSRCALGL